MLLGDCRYWCGGRCLSCLLVAISLGWGVVGYLCLYCRAGGLVRGGLFQWFFI